MNKTSSRSALFLLEMIFVIFFFALTAAVYVRVFALSRTTATHSRDLSEAVIVAQNLAELFYDTDGDAERIRLTYGSPDAKVETENGTDILTLYYDDAWEKADASSASYRADVSMHTEDDFRLAEITLSDLSSGGDALYTLTLKKYLPQEGGPDR